MSTQHLPTTAAKSSRFRSRHATAVLFAALTAAGLTTSASAGDVTKANNTTALDAGASWTGSTVPTSTDTVTWNTTGTVKTGTADLTITGLTFGPTLAGNVSITGAQNGTSIVAASWSDTTETITLNGHGFSNGNRVYLPSITTANGATALAGLQANTAYFVVGATANTFQLATTSGGAAIDFTKNASTALTVRGGGGSLVIGTGGIDLSAAPAARTVTIAANTVLNGNQTWTTGGTANTTQLTASGLLSGTGSLTLAGSGAGGLIQLSGINTFSGGLTINSGANVKMFAPASASGGTVISGAAGTGPLTINGGTIYGGVDVNASVITIGGDFTVNSGASTNTNNGRLGLGGAIALGNATRTITLGHTRDTAQLAATNQSLRLATLTSGTVVTGPALSVANGTLAVVAEVGGKWAGLSLNSATSYTNNSGLTIGSNVITATGTSGHFGTGSNAPTLTVLAGGVFNTSDGTVNTRSSSIAGLNGAGVVTNLATAAGTSVITLGNNNTSGSFSGKILDGATANTQLNLGFNAPVGLVAITKIGTGTQTFSGANSYSGATVVSAGTLNVGADNALSSTSAITVASGATLDMNGFSASAASLTFTQGSKLSFDLGTAGNTTALLSLTNGFTKAGTTGLFSIELNGGEVGTYKLVSFTGISAFTASNFTAVLGTDYAGNFSINNGALSFTVTAIPEPSTFAALAGLGVLGLAIYRRRSDRSSK